MSPFISSSGEMVHIAKEMKIHHVDRYDFKDRGISGSGTESKATSCGVVSNVDLAHLETKLLGNLTLQVVH